MSVQASRVRAVYVEETFRTGPTGDDLTTDRTDVDVQGRVGADNGMYYWRARRRDPHGVYGGPGRWSIWRSYEPGSVVTQEQLYWGDDHADELPTGACSLCGEDTTIDQLVWENIPQVNGWVCQVCRRAAGAA